MAESKPHWVQPSHPNLISVQKGARPFSSRAVSLQEFAPGAVVARMSEATPARDRAYTSVQVSKDADIELNSDLVYCNHSCNPSLEFDMGKMEVRVVADRPLRKGEDLTFFYPSTEWDMVQPFDCDCSSGDGVCVGQIQGAKHLSSEVLRRYWLNDHIKQLLAENKPKSNGHAVNGNGHV